MLETMSLIAYRQPITRGEIEAVRGVSVSTSIIRTLQEREWIRVVGHRDVPGKPALFGTTKIFLDYFDLQNLDDLPTLAEIRDMENLEPELDLDPVMPAADVREEGQKPEADVETDSEGDGGEIADENGFRVGPEMTDEFVDNDFDDDDFEEDESAESEEIKTP